MGTLAVAELPVRAKTLVSASPLVPAEGGDVADLVEVSWLWLEVHVLYEL